MTPPAFPGQGYGLIMADPPWHFDTYSAKGGAKSPQAHYATMTMTQIAALPVADLAADDCLLWLWATAPILPQAMAILEGWGFAYVTMGWWTKRGPAGPTMGTGYWLRQCGEPFLIGKRGRPPVVDRALPSVIEAPRREHSRKPDAAFAHAERMAPGVRRIELFSRQSRPGWDGWGLEAGKFDGDAA